MLFDGKVAIVSGSGPGLGREVALGLARVEERYSWTSVAAATVTGYETAIRKTENATQKRNARADR